MSEERDEKTGKCCGTCLWWARWMAGDSLGDCKYPLPAWSKNAGDDGYQPTGRLYGSNCDAWHKKGSE